MEGVGKCYTKVGLVYLYSVKIILQNCMLLLTKATLISYFKVPKVFMILYFEKDVESDLEYNLS